MKRQNYIKLVFLGVSLGLCISSYGWENKATPPALTEKSIADSVIDDYIKNQLGIDGGVNSELQSDVDWYNAYIRKRMERGGVENPGKTNRTILEWLKAGSNYEDEDIYIDKPPEEAQRLKDFIRMREDYFLEVPEDLKPKEIAVKLSALKTLCQSICEKPNSCKRSP